MRVGYSFSPGGLLLPYHLGVLDALQEHNALNDETPLAGSSAGAIAVACHGCAMNTKKVLDLNIEMHDHCHVNHNSVARGNLLPLLRSQLNKHIGPQQLENIRNRPGLVGIAYKELFPRNRAIFQTEFDSEHDLINAVCHSSTFPFFSTNFPFALDTSGKSLLPRLVVDGFFTVPRDRFGCPDFQQAAQSDEDYDNVVVDRTVTVSVFPQSHIGLHASNPEDCISPLAEYDDDEEPSSTVDAVMASTTTTTITDKETKKETPRQLRRLFGLATKPSSKERVFGMYESGLADAERWCLSQHGNGDMLRRRTTSSLEGLDSGNLN